MLLLWLACADPPLPAQAGELTFVQLDLDGPSIGESALIVSPEGSVTLLDVGNDRHDGAVREALLRYTGDTAVDFILLTHNHADHIGAMSDLVDDITLRGAMIDRGPYDLAEGAANLDEWSEVCELELPRVALCEGDVPAPCQGGEGPWPASACPGQGELFTDADAGPSWLDLGGARLEILAVDGFVGDQRLTLGYGESADENARSVVAVLRYGDFTMMLPGDLTGGGKGTPDMESLVIAAADPGPVDLLQLGHHGISSSTSEGWVEALLPEGARHDALVGANRGYLDAPSEEALARVLPRLGGGAVWVTEPGRLAQGEAFCDAEGDVVLRVASTGDWSLSVPGDCP